MGLAAIYLVLALAALKNHLIGIYPLGVDLQIPLRAAERWIAGGEVYQASAFTAPPGASQPFLYPPYVLPFVSLLLGLPRFPLLVVWFGVCLLSALFTLRRLAFPIAWWPFVLIWPPFAEGIIAGNVQVPMFACFVALFWRPSRAGPFLPDERDVADPNESPSRLGLLAGAIGALKVSQLQPWLILVRHRWQAALIAVAAGLLLVAATLPITGITLWADWLAQLRRATDTTWDLGGIALTRFTPPGVGLAVTIVTLLAVLALPSRGRVGAWVGVLSVLGTPSLHPFGLLFLIPAMLIIRRELALLGALLITTYTYEGSWAGIVVVSVAFIGTLRWPALLEETDRSQDERLSPPGSPTGGDPTRS